LIDFVRACLVRGALVSNRPTDIEKGAEGEIPVRPAVDLLGRRTKIAEERDLKRLASNRKCSGEMESVFDRANDDRVADGNGLIVAPYAIEPAERLTGLGHEAVVEGVLATDPDGDLMCQGRGPFGRGVPPGVGKEEGL